MNNNIGATLAYGSNFPIQRWLDAKHQKTQEGLQKRSSYITTLPGLLPELWEIVETYDRHDHRHYILCRDFDSPDMSAAGEKLTQQKGSYPYHENMMHVLASYPQYRRVFLALPESKLLGFSIVAEFLKRRDEHVPLTVVIFVDDLNFLKQYQQQECHHIIIYANHYGLDVILIQNSFPGNIPPRLRVAAKDIVMDSSLHLASRKIREWYPNNWTSFRLPNSTIEFLSYHGVESQRFLSQNTH